jgi:hypothetical protein
MYFYIQQVFLGLEKSVYYVHGLGMRGLSLLCGTVKEVGVL